MSLAVLFHFLCTQHVSDINMSIRSLRLCCWITTSVVLFCKDGELSVGVNLWCWVVCVWCDVLCGVEWGVFGVMCLVALLKLVSVFSFILTVIFYALWSLCSPVCSVFHGWLVIWHIVNVLCYINLRLYVPRFFVCWRCWVQRKWNKIASDIKLVFYSSTSQCYSEFWPRELLQDGYREPF